MTDLISRAALLDEFRSLCGPQTGDGWDNWGVHNLIMRQKAVYAVPVGWIIDRANDPERAPLYRRYAQMLYEEWRKEQEAQDE